MATPITDAEGNFLYYEDDPVSWDPFDPFWNTPTTSTDPWDIMESTRELANINSTADADAALTNIETNYGKDIADAIKGFIFKDGKLNLGGIAGAGVALYGMLGGNEAKTAGYNKPVPQSTLVREQIPYAADPNRRPGEAGRQYFTPSKFVAPADAAAAQAAAKTQAQGIAAAYTPRPPQVNPYAGTFKTPWENAPTTPATNTQTPPSRVIDLMPVPTAESLNMAQGGIANLARGRYLSGSTDGMADEIPTSIDGKDPAALSHGEFVIPADVVSHLGNGNSEAGAEKLYAMMERVRKARTGNPKQGKRINPDKFMPGGLAYAGGGEVKKFAGETGSVVPPPTPTVGSSVSSSLSPWAGPYVTNLLSRGEAIAQGPYQAYQGPLTAGASDLQQKAFAGIQSLADAGYTPTTFTSGTFGSEQAQQYMNPYIQAALNPQLAEMKRQSDIARLDDTSRLAKAGAFGGSRQAIMESEGRRNLLDKQTQAIGTGYQTAYDKAMQQFNTEQDRQLGVEKETEASRRYSADYGLKSLGELSRLGDIQRSITAEGIAADKKAFEEERDYDAGMVKFQRDLITGLPISTQATTQNTTGVGNITSSIGGAQGVIDALRKLGINI